MIKRRADEDGLSASAVERDYVLAHALTAISECDRAQQLVFKGGTALRLCHFADYRYSADLDFSLTGHLDARPRFVKLDLAPDELVEDTALLPIDSRYEDQGEGRCRVYTREEIAAEKLRCVMQRLQCRDLYDLHELLVVNDVDAEAVWPLFERKARHRDRDPDRFGESFADRVPRWEERWDGELIEYLASPPEFDGVLRAVRRELRFALAN
jgi:predicted nucleotidyltransferase component of viral defense system